MSKAKHYEIHFTKKQALLTALTLMVCFLLAFSLGTMIGMKYLHQSATPFLSSSPQTAPPAPAEAVPGDMESRILSNPEGNEVVEFTFYNTLPKSGETSLSPQAALEKKEPHRKPSPAQAAGSPQEITTAVPTQKYVIQLGSFQQVEKAYALANKLKKQGHLAYVATNTIEKKTWHRVRMGPFNTQEEAQSWASQLPPLSPAPFITSLRD